MTHDADNPYLPLAFEEPRDGPREWRVAELSAFAWQGVVVAVGFAPFQLAYQLFGGWLGPMLTTSPVARLSLSLVGVTLDFLSHGVLLMTCAKLVVHRRSALHFPAAGAGLRLGIILRLPNVDTPYDQRHEGF